MSRRRRPPVRRRPSVRSGTGTVSAGIDARSARCRGHAARPSSPRADGSVAPAPRSALQACRYRGLLQLFAQLSAATWCRRLPVEAVQRVTPHEQTFTAGDRTRLSLVCDCGYPEPLEVDLGRPWVELDDRDGKVSRCQCSRW